MKIENYYDRIDQYHTGELSDNDSKSFERELNSNEELRQAEELYRLSLNVLDYGVEENLRKDLKNWAAEGKETSKGGRIISLRSMIVVLSAAASVLLLIFFAAPYFMPQPSPSELFATYYQTPEASNLRGGSVPQNAINAAKKALAEESYADAVEDLAKIPSGDPLYIEAQFYLGHAMIGLNNLPAAKNAFELVAASTEVKFQEKGEWNYLLVCLKADQWNDICEAKLKTIAQDADHSFSAQAKELLKKMK